MNPAERRYKMDIGSCVAVMKALSDPHRLRAVMALREGERCVCQLIALLELAPSTVSRHMTLLRQAGIVVSRQSGKRVYYSLADDGSASEVEVLVNAALNSIQDDRTVKDDRSKMSTISKTDPEIRCTT